MVFFFTTKSTKDTKDTKEKQGLLIEK